MSGLRLRLAPKARESGIPAWRYSVVQDATKGVRRFALRMEFGNQGLWSVLRRGMQPWHSPPRCFSLLHPVQSVLGT